LPCPSDEVSIGKVREVSERYADERLRLLAAIDQLAAALTTGEGGRRRRAQAAAASRDVQYASRSRGVVLAVWGLLFSVAVAAGMGASQPCVSTEQEGGDE
jgi:hypothetical protein